MSIATTIDRTDDWDEVPTPTLVRKGQAIFYWRSLDAFEGCADGRIDIGVVTDARPVHDVRVRAVDGDERRIPRLLCGATHDEAVANIRWWFAQAVRETNEQYCEATSALAFAKEALCKIEAALTQKE